MITGLYSAASALQAAARHHEVVAENLANVNVPGYRRQVVLFESFERLLAEAQGPEGTAESLLGTEAVAVQRSFEPGPLQFTDNPLDVAIVGDGFFELVGPAGPLYTRNGCFGLNGQGQLISQAGLPVAGQGGPITLPAGATISVDRDGAVRADGVEVGRLRIVQFDDPGVLVPAGTTMFRAPPGVRPTGAGGEVRQGYREMSNVNVVDELVSMIAGMRYYESAQRALQAIADTVQYNTDPQMAG